MQIADSSPDPASRTVLGRVLVLMCTYNEADNIELMIDGIRQALPRADILVVDDSSPDGTAEWVQRRAAADPGIHLLVRQEKTGLGDATRCGLLWALERDYEFIINLDADLSHDPNAAPRLLQTCQDGPFDVVVGSRYLPGGGFDGLPWHRRWISRALNGYAIRVLGLPISDCSGSYRCYRASALRSLDWTRLHCRGYGFLEEILVALQRCGARIGQTPIRFRARHKGHSKLSMADAVGALRVIHRMAWQRSQKPSPPRPE